MPEEQLRDVAASRGVREDEGIASVDQRDEADQIFALLELVARDELDRRDLELMKSGVTSCRERARRLGISDTGLARREKKRLGRAIACAPPALKALLASRMKP